KPFTRGLTVDIFWLTFSVIAGDRVQLPFKPLQFGIHSVDFSSSDRFSFKNCLLSGRRTGAVGSPTGNNATVWAELNRSISASITVLDIDWLIRFAGYLGDSLLSGAFYSGCALLIVCSYFECFSRSFNIIHIRYLSVFG